MGPFWSYMFECLRELLTSNCNKKEVFETSAKSGYDVQAMHQRLQVQMPLLSCRVHKCRHYNKVVKAKDLCQCKKEKIAVL